jgi:hypothetical protein
VVQLGPQIVSPSYHREPWFSGSEISDRFYAWQCTSCEAEVRVSLSSILNEAWPSEPGFGAQLAEAARSHFKLSAAGRSHDGGFPSLVLSACASCGTRYLLYAGVSEPSNSVFSVVIQGLSEVRRLTRRCS